MLLKNNTGKIIGIGMESILPGATAPCPKGYENNPVVQQYIKNGTFEKINETVAEPAPEVKAEPEKSTAEPAAEEESKVKGKAKA